MRLLLSNRYLICIYVCIVVSALVSLARANDMSPPTVPLTGYPVWLNKQITALADDSGKLTIEQVEQATASFVTSPTSVEEITKHNVYWLKFRLRNLARRPLPCLPV